MSVTGD
jgi:hypothetical protein